MEVIITKIYITTVASILDHNNIFIRRKKHSGKREVFTSLSFIFLESIDFYKETGTWFTFLMIGPALPEGS